MKTTYYVYLHGKQVEFQERRKRLKLRKIIDATSPEERNMFILLARRASPKKLDKIEASLPLVKIEDVLAKIPERKRHVRTRLTNILRDNHITYARELLDIPREVFERWKHAGHTSAEILARALAKFGFHFEGENK